ncbi:MAG: hypothetical protein Q9164_002368 [Protoblastenia rupestris]
MATGKVKVPAAVNNTAPGESTDLGRIKSLLQTIVGAAFVVMAFLFKSIRTDSASEYDRQRLVGTWPPIRTDHALLFVNKRVSQLAFLRFYSYHLFHIPPGSVIPSMTYFQRLSIDDRKAIRHIGLRIGLWDLTPDVLDEIEREVARLRLGDPETMTIGQKAHRARVFAVTAANYVSDIWKGKIAALQAFGGVTTLRVLGDKPGDHFYIHTDLQQRLRGIDLPGQDYEACEEQIRKVLRSAYQGLRDRIRTDVLTQGWEETKD